MTLYERIVGSISEDISRIYGEISFSVDIPKTSVGFDFYSNASKISKKEIYIGNENPFIKVQAFENGFLNIKLKDQVLLDFVSDFDLSISERVSDTDDILRAYIQLAENEKKFSGNKYPPMQLTADVRRVILFLMKIQFLSSSGTKKDDIIKTEVMSLLDKIRLGCDNLKTFVIIYEPLLIAVRGSLAKY